MEAIEGFAPGLHQGVPDDVYHARKLYVVNKTGIDRVNQSPAHFKVWVEGGVVRESPALDFGQAFHCATLEPAVFAERYAVEPDFGDCRYKDNKTARDTWRAKNAFKRSLSGEHSDAITAMAASVRAHPIAGKLLVGGVPELTVLWNDEATGLPCKSRADYYVADKQLVVDLKTTLDASEREFKRSVVSYRYHVQDALYRSGFAAVGAPIQHFIFVAVEKTPPYAVAVYALDADAVAAGFAAARKNINTLSDCVRFDRWPSYSDHIVTLELPKWAA